MDPGNLVWSIEFQYYFIVDPRFLNWTLRFQRGLLYFNVDHNAVSVVCQCGSWDFSVETEISVWILRLQCVPWETSVDAAISVWIQELKHGSLVSKVNPGIPMWILGFP